MATKIKTAKPVVEMLGEEMAGLSMEQIKEHLIVPFLDIDIIPFDLSAKNRDASDDKITRDAVAAVMEHGVGVKGSTVTPTKEQAAAQGLKANTVAFKSPNGIIREAMQASLFREALVYPNVPQPVPSRTGRTLIGRLGTGDMYDAKEFLVQGDNITVQFTDDTGAAQSKEIKIKKGKIALLVQANAYDDYQTYLRMCFHKALEEKLDLCVASKHTIAKITYGGFQKIARELFDAEFKEKFAALGLTFREELIDNAAFQMIKAGDRDFMLVLPNYDGDVISDVEAGVRGSLGLMKSYLLSPTGQTLAEIVAGTAPDIYRDFHAGVKTSYNPLANIHAWTEALKARGRLDATPDVVRFAETLERVCSDLVIEGHVTRDLASLFDRQEMQVRHVESLADDDKHPWFETLDYIQLIKTTLAARL